MSLKAAIIGAGNGGTAIAVHMTSCGAEVHLCDLFPEYLKDIQDEYITLTDTEHGTEQKLKPALVTADLEAALAGTQLIMVVTPAFTHRMIAERCAKYLTDGQVVVLNPGRTAGSLEFLETIRKAGCTKDVVIAEAQTLIYSCRRIGPTNVEVYGTKKAVDVSAIPGERIGYVMELLNVCYPQFKPTESVIGTSLANIGSMFHPTPVLMNVGRIETDANGFKYYWEAISPTVAKVVEQLDAERLAVGAAYGTKLLSAFEWLDQSYPVHGDTLYERIQSNEAYGHIKAPTSVDVRYLTDDVPNGLVPIEALGKAAGVETPCISAVITLGCAMFRKDYRKEGRSLENIGLAGLNKEQVIDFFRTGKR